MIVSIPLADMQTNDNEIALNPIKPRDSRQEAPSFEPQLLEQTQTGFVMAEDATDQRADLEARSARNRLPEQMPSNATTPEIFPHIHAHLRRPAICAARNEGMKTKPAGEHTIDFSHPEWMAVR